MANYFKEEGDTPGWDGRIHMQSVPNKLNWLELSRPLPCGDSYIPANFRWNGASSGLFEKLIILNFPKWKHPIASCRHDWRCLKARTKKERAIADKLFYNDIGEGGTKWEQIKGYIGVRIGAFFGVAVRY